MIVILLPNQKRWNKTKLKKNFILTERLPFLLHWYCLVLLFGMEYIF